ncbi:hypothetical protein GCM10027451_39400 [Geodermatophilus aquaeductus]|uniref:Uncharacterized protein n=1 Tax=Geodermatophilus aquaeductus TaxID=1564161 RepID=A0A521FFM6_9ACTN|nr:hypothetical protein [Geodermatophilus aquaeductus]SMO94949.1 hypothetical protein SAMN06273567_108197 [Geodermatophilus aquaeductus]
MEHRVEVIWTCAPCEVGGRDADEGGDDPRCWNCDGPVVVVGRPAVLQTVPESDAA